MQVHSIFPGQGKKIQTVGLAAFISAAVLFALGFVLMLTAQGALMGHQLPLILMTVAAVDMCFAAALTAGDMPGAERVRLRTLSVVGAIVVVVAATMIASNFRVGAFEIVILLAVLAGAPGLFKLGEMTGAKLKASEKAAPKAEAKSAAVQKTASEAPEGEGGATAG